MSNTTSTTMGPDQPANAGPVLHGDDGTKTPLPLNNGPEAPKQENPANVDKKLVEETQQHIRILVSEIAELAKRDISTAQFYEGFTTRCVTALSSIGGAVWLKQQDQLNLEHQVNLTKTNLHAEGPTTYQHDRLLGRLFKTGAPTTVPPTSINHSDDSGNPTPYLLVIAPIMQDGKPIGLIEIFQRPGAGPVTQRGYLRFLIQMAEIASDYHKARRLRQLDERQTLWNRLDQFLTNVHQSLEVQETCYNLSNEGRRLIECDRLSIATAKGSRLQVASTSGLEMVQRRADQVKLMEKLATAVCRAKKPLYYTGNSDNLPPQIENCLQDYLDLSHCKALAVVPLVHSPKSDSDAEGQKKKNGNEKPKLLGAMIVEQLSDQTISEDQSNRVTLVAQHGAAALANANQYNSLFLLPLWKFLGQFRWFTQAANLPKTLTAVIVLAVVCLLLVALPYEFAMPAKGVIQPVHRRGIYAMVDGIVKDVALPDQQNVEVKAGQALLSMTNKDFDTEEKVLRGEIDQLAEIHHAAQLRQGQTEDPLERLKLQGEIQETYMSHDAKRKQLQNLLDKRELLKVTAPIAGQIDNLNVKQDLLGRPVLAGDRLMTVLDPTREWELELYLPERGAGHVLDYYDANEEPLQVEFVLASNAEQTFTGTVKKIDRKAEVHPVHGNSLKVLVHFEKEELADALRRTGTRVTAKIHCGKQPLGYVMFREVWESAQSQLLFWF